MNIDTVETGALTPAPVAEFDPGEGVIPLPNNLLLDPATRRIQLPPSCGEEEGSATAALRATLNQLDGFGTSRLAIRASLSDAPDPDSLAGRVFLIRIAERGVPLTEFEGPVPIDVQAIADQRLGADCMTPIDVNEILMTPRAPLLEASTYAALITSGIETEQGAQFQPSATWALLRQSMAPVQFAELNGAAPTPEAVTHNATPFDPAQPDDLEALVGLDRLWRAHAPVLGAFDALGPALVSGELAREDILLAWSFNTQTTTDPLNASVDGSPAAIATTAAAITLPPPLAGSMAAIEAFFARALPLASCDALGCAAIGAIYAGAPGAAAPSLLTPTFQSGDDCDPVTPTPGGAWSDPLTPVAVCDQSLPLVAVVPATPAPPTGYPTVIFAHGLGRSKEDLLAIAGTFASAGFASVAIDATRHGARAVQVSTDAALGCAGPAPESPCEQVLAPTCAPQCYAPILSADLAATRDNLRQTVVDQLALAAALTSCREPGACETLQVDPDRIVYVGQSLGALIGSVTVAMSEMPAGVLSVGGADWLRVLTDTATLAIRCPLVDALIHSGAILGETWDGGQNPDATCTGESWKTTPGFVQFAQAARWVLDPVDGVNFTAPYRAAEGPELLLAEVEDDPVIPNTATETFGKLLELEPAAAAVAISVPPEASPEALLPGSRWIEYFNIAADRATSFPGNGYGHGSLLAPAEPSAERAAGSGELGTALMRVDTVTYLVTHY